MRGFVNGVLLCLLMTATTFAQARSVTSLGRIEPLNGVYQIAGPTDASVVSKLWVEEGQRSGRATFSRRSTRIDCVTPKSK
jgi:hypothetical protein